MPGARCTLLARLEGSAHMRSGASEAHAALSAAQNGVLRQPRSPCRICCRMCVCTRTVSRLARSNLKMAADMCRNAAITHYPVSATWQVRSTRGWPLAHPEPTGITDDMLGPLQRHFGSTARHTVSTVGTRATPYRHQRECGTPCSLLQPIRTEGLHWQLHWH